MIRRWVKIPGALVKKEKGNVNLTHEELEEKGYIVGASNSQLTEWLDELHGTTSQDLENLHSELRRQRFYKQAKELEFINELVQVEYNSDKQFVESFMFNGVEFKWLNSKGDSTNTYIRVGLLDEIVDRLNNGRNTDIKFIPAKLNAYIGLSMSSSTRVSDENQPRKVIVVKDNVTEFEATYKYVGTDGVKEVTEMITLEASDGNGVIDYRLLEKWSKEDLGYVDHVSSGVSVRSAFLKGMVFPVDLQKFFEQHQVKEITDVWGTTHSIDNIDVIIPTSMLKLWQSYSSYEEYERNCKENGYKWRICKESHDVKASRTNYQMLTDLIMTDEQINALIQPTIDYLSDVAGRDWLSTVLYLNGQTLSETSTNVRGIEQALMIEPELIHDKSVVQNINRMLQKRKNDACLGRLNVSSDYQIISSDLYNFLCSSCGIESTGLLKAGQVYSRWHLDKDLHDALLFRSPMISKENIARVEIVDSEELRDFYQYMTNIVVLNDWDLTCDTLAGADKDGDTVMCITDKALLEVHEKVLPCRCETCESSIVKKIKCGRKELLNGAKIGCSNKYNIGSLINKVTSQFSVRSMFSEDSREYKVLSDRILQGLMFSQSYIDAKKLGCAYEPPKFWFSLKECDKLDCSEEEREFQKSICTQGKKPYFMVMYQGQSENDRKRYKSILQEIDFRSKCYWGISAEELLAMKYDEMNDDQRLLVNHWSKDLPCYLQDNSTMHRISTMTEEMLVKVKCDSHTKNCSELMKNPNERQGDVEIEKTIDGLLTKYNVENKKIYGTKMLGEKEEIKAYRAFRIEELQQQLKYVILEECRGNSQLALNCLINVCNKRDNSFNMIWNLFADEVIENLLIRNDYKMQIPVQDKDGNLEYQSRKFKIEVVDVREK